jgi:hypothetical protein
LSSSRRERRRPRAAKDDERYAAFFLATGSSMIPMIVGLLHDEEHLFVTWGGPLVVPWLTAWRRVRGVIFARKRRLKIS